MVDLAPLWAEPRILRNWQRTQRLTVSEWADRHRILDNRFSSEHGPWRTERTPHAREWMDSAAVPWVRQISIVGGTQVGKTESMNNILGFYAHHRPSPAMLVLPSNDLALTASQRRIRPMFETSPALAGELSDRKSDTKNREIALRRSVIYLRSAQSPGSLASVPVRLVIGDETEKWPAWSGDEASPLSLVRERTRTFWDHVIVLACTPKFRGGVIDREFHAGDQRRFHVPCPHCQAWLVFEWQHVRWDRERITTHRQMREVRSAWYECQHCRKRIDDAQKFAMCARGVWIPAGVTPKDWFGGLKDTERCEHRSYHIWAAYSPWLSWWKIVAEFLRSKDEPQELMNFTNSWLAEVWEDKVEGLTDDAVNACVERRPAGQVPADVRVVTAAVDVQKDRLEWAVVGWGTDEECWVIDAGSVPLMADGADWKRLADILLRNSYGQHRVACCLVDWRHRSDEVLEFARAGAPIVRPIAGVERESPELFHTRKLERHPRTGAPLPNSVTLWTINVGQVKDLVAARLRKAVTEPESRAGRIHLPSGLPPDWLTQLCSEHKVRERTGKRHVDRWVLRPGHKRNESWDLLTYNVAAARMIFVHKLRSEDQPKDGVAAKPKAPPPKRPRRPLHDRFPMSGRNT